MPREAQRAVHIAANHHAGYFPGAEEMLLKLVYENGTGRVLRAQVVDVRDAIEIAELPLANAPHATQIPLDELRDRVGELDPSRSTLVLCHSGLRSYIGTRILAQHGFTEVFNLSGAASVRELALNRRTPVTI